LKITQDLTIQALFASEFFSRIYSIKVLYVIRVISSILFRSFTYSNHSKREFWIRWIVIAKCWIVQLLKTSFIKAKFEFRGNSRITVQLYRKKSAAPRLPPLCS